MPQPTWRNRYDYCYLASTGCYLTFLSNDTKSLNNFNTSYLTIDIPWPEMFMSGHILNPCVGIPEKF